MVQKQRLLKILVPGFYLVAMALVMFSAWNDQKTVRQGGGSPLYRNLMEKPAYIRQGFDPTELLVISEELRIIPQELQIPANKEGWTGFKSTPLRVMNSLLPDLPKRPFLSPKRIDEREYTIIIPVELDDTAMSFLDANPALIPGIFIAYIGENWEIFFNGVSVLSEIHLKESGQIKERRTWRSVYFPIDRTFIVPGTNILALRVIGDPTHLMTGLSYNAPHYMDDYRLVERRQNKFPLILLCGIFGFTGVYYLAIFFFLRKKLEIFNLYFGIYSILICMYVAARHGLLKSLIPNSEITLSMEFGSLMMMMPLFFMFIENLSLGRVTKPTWFFLAVSFYFTLTQMFFPAQYREDVIVVWNIYIILIHYPYIIIYDIIYFYLFDKKRIRSNDDVSGTLIINIIVGTLAGYFCAAFDILDVLFFHLSYSLFPYSNFVVHIGMSFALASRFSGMYKQLEQSHAGLEKAVRERTLELEEQTRIAVKASRAKSEFLTAMSHEIRTPLNTVIGLSEIELRERLPDSSRENIEQIQQSGSTLLGIIGDILDISKIEAGSFELSPVTYETASLLNDTVNLNAVRIGSKPINFITEINGDFPARLVGDNLRIKQILNNLLSNAIKYTEEGTVTFTVTWEKIENLQPSDPVPPLPTVLLRFAVKDTGIGIRAEDFCKLFENYSQIEGGADRKIEGTGLGLAITKQIVQMMGGGITVESEYGKGSCFTAEIIQSLADGAVIGEETAENLRNFRYATGRKKETIDYLSLGGVQVLVVDDNTANLLVARGLLAPYGLTVDTAASGQEAINKVKRKNYNMIFMDHMMPGMDGVATVGIIREWEKEQKKTKDEIVEFPQEQNATQIPIIALTANALRGMREFYLENGFNDYLSKPIYTKALDEVITKYFKEKGRREKREKGKEKKEERNVNIVIELEARRLDMLNHFRAAFDSGRTIDSEYFKKFTALIESLETTDNLREQAVLLIEAGRREDAQTIRKILPVFYDASFQETALQETEGFQNPLDEILSRLKTALHNGETKTAETILSELGSVKLDPAGRELYFNLYDFLVNNNREKALDTIYSWERLKNA